MNTQSRLKNLVFSPFVLWVIGIAVGSYFMVTFDKKKLSQPSDPGIIGTIKQYYNAASLAYIKKGIDLEGGTYLVLTVEIEKALESRLNLESRSIETLLKSKNSALPTKKEVKDLALVLTFADDAMAKSAYAIIQESRSQTLKLAVRENALVATLMQDVERSIRTGAVDQGVSVLSNRLGGYGVEGIVVQQHGDRQIVIQLPGVDDPEHVKQVVTKTAHLEFKIVEKVAGTKDSLLDEFDGDLPSDKMIIPGKADADLGEAGRWYLVSTFPDLTGEHLVSAKVDHDEFNRPVVGFKLDGSGAREFADLTANNVGRNLGIIIDNIMITAPVVNQAITGGSGVISGIGSAKEAFDLSVVLRSGSLQAPLKIEQENRIGASLGQDSINKGILSCLVALVLLFIFSLLYYKIPGLLAIITLLVNIFLTLLFLSYFRATLTLPGIAGIVLTIGMAIDASILIFERVKEDLDAGIPLRKAVFGGFNGAMSVILDSNITTFLTGMVLYQFGGPAIKGFAVTLMAGIVATVLSGIYFLKAMFAFIFDFLNVKRLKF